MALGHKHYQPSEPELDVDTMSPPDLNLTVPPGWLSSIPSTEPSDDAFARVQGARSARHFLRTTTARECAADSSSVPTASVVFGGQCGNGFDSRFRVAGEGARVLVSALGLKQDGGHPCFAEVGER